MEEIAPGVRMIDTLLAGWTGVTAAYLVTGEDPALVDTGARTSAQAVRDALAAAGIGRDDLRWIVLTHVHLDHCGATGILAHASRGPGSSSTSAAPATSPSPAAWSPARRRSTGSAGRSTAASTRRPADRIDAADDGHAVELGGGRRLRMVATPGHARHHMAVHDEASGAVIAGDALGLRFRGAGPYPALPPPEIDPTPPAWPAWTRVAGAAAHGALPGALRPGPGPGEAIADARRRLALAAEAARAAPDPGALAAGLERAIPMAASLGDPGAVALLERLGWAPQTWTACGRGAAGSAASYCLRDMKSVRVDLVVIGVRERHAEGLLVRLPASVWALPGATVPSRRDARGGRAGRPGRRRRASPASRSSSSTPSTGTRGRGSRSRGSASSRRGATP